MPMQVVTRLEEAKKGAKRTEAAMCLVALVMDPARRSVRHEHVKETAPPETVADQRGGHPKDGEPDIELLGLVRTTAVPRRAFEPGNKDTVDPHHASVEVDAPPPSTDGGI